MQLPRSPCTVSLTDTRVIHAQGPTMQDSLLAEEGEQCYPGRASDVARDRTLTPWHCGCAARVIGRRNGRFTQMSVLLFAQMPPSARIDFSSFIVLPNIAWELLIACYQPRSYRPDSSKRSSSVVTNYLAEITIDRLSRRKSTGQGIGDYIG
jgi:hypothetical protein